MWPTIRKCGSSLSHRVYTRPTMRIMSNRVLFVGKGPIITRPQPPKPPSTDELPPLVVNV